MSVRITSSRLSEIRRIAPDSDLYPQTLQERAEAHALPTVTTLGDVDVLNHRKLALFCSTHCPGSLILQTFDLAQVLRDADITVIGGFHTPMERECLELLLRGKQPIIVCPARGIDSRTRLPANWRVPLSNGRLLLLSPFDPRERRTTAELASKRNRFVAALADEVFVAYAAPGSRTERFARDVANTGKPLLTLNSPDNATLLALGARALRLGDYRPPAGPNALAGPDQSPAAIPLPLFD
jgi:predicted Rossmann fold nucleotide-binding protein DprA/Smf involved in DNA uptake